MSSSRPRLPLLRWDFPCLRSCGRVTISHVPLWFSSVRLLNSICSAESRSTGCVQSVVNFVQRAHRHGKQALRLETLSAERARSAKQTHCQHDTCHCLAGATQFLVILGRYHQLPADSGILVAMGVISRRSTWRTYDLDTQKMALKALESSPHACNCLTAAHHECTRSIRRLPRSPTFDLVKQKPYMHVRGIPTVDGIFATPISQFGAPEIPSADQVVRITVFPTTSVAVHSENPGDVISPDYLDR